jgi:gliding motility-associated-like protein
VWSVAGLSSYVNADLNIFDRYGTRVFTSRGYNNPWNGTRNGTPLPVGVYYYVLNLNDGKTPAKSGSVTLLR